MRKGRATALIIVLAFLIIVSTMAFATLSLFQSQHAITYSLMQLDEIRYAEEMGLRHGLWVWRYKYNDPAYLNNGIRPYETTLPINGYNVEGVWVRIEDKDQDRRLDSNEIETKVNKVPFTP